MIANCLMQGEERSAYRDAEKIRDAVLSDWSDAESRPN
jgi:hypothetical protein